MSNVYQGHLNDGSSIQRHSAGGLYPCVIYQQQQGPVLKSGVISPENQDGVLVGSYNDACAYADKLNVARRERQAQANRLLAFQQGSWFALNAARVRFQGGAV